MTKRQRKPMCDVFAEFVMWWGVAALLLCGLLVGKRQFSRIMDDIFGGSKVEVFMAEGDTEA